MINNEKDFDLDFDITVIKEQNNSIKILRNAKYNFFGGEMILLGIPY